MKAISPDKIKIITNWVAQNFPDSEIQFTNYSAETGADGIYFEALDFTIDQAIELIEMREQVALPVGLCNTGKLDIVSFNILYPHPGTISTKS
jgi:hypothetical protein